MNQPKDDGSRRAKNIAAILYLLVLTFLVGGSYIHQQRQSATTSMNAPDNNAPATPAPANAGVAN